MQKRKTDTEFKAEVKSLVGNEYTFLEPYKYARTKIMVKHNKCGFLYQVQPNNFLHGQRCPYCARKSKKMSDREFQNEVKRLGNNNYLPLQKYKGSKVKILMLHKKCGNKYYVRPHDFISGNRCPFCRYTITAKKRSMKFSEIQERVKKIANGEYKVLPKGYRNTHTKINFYHLKCNRFFQMTPHCFFSGQRCPFCKASKGEKIVKEYLEKKDIHFKFQFRINDCRDKKALPFDFAIFNSDKTLNCLIEYQGEQHFYNPFSWERSHGPFNSQSVLDTQKHDAMKLQYCKDHGIKLIRINHPQTSSKSNSIEFIERLVNRTLNKELRVS